MAKAREAILAHWNGLIEGLQASPMDFYGQVEGALAKRKIPDIKTSRVDWKEGGILSAKREYLRVERREHIIDICGAPFGSGFFVSWWLGEYQGCLASLADAPILGFVIKYFVKPHTYYQADTAAMFRTSVSSAVQEVVDQMSAAKGIRQLTADERKPVLKEFFAR